MTRNLHFKHMIFGFDSGDRKGSVFCGVTLCSFVERCQRFGETYQLNNTKILIFILKGKFNFRTGLEGPGGE
jgi:hypothetical protein